MELLYHHCRSLDSIVFGEVKAGPEYFDPDFKGAYLWLKNEVGFYPLFLAVGVTNEDLRMTGYQSQWRRLLAEGPHGKEYRTKGDFPNDVLFSFEDITGKFMDFDYWHIVLNASYKDYRLTEYEKKLIFKPSWSKSKWLRKARRDLHSVQLVAPKLYLPLAKRIYVRNKKTKRLLELLGFKNIEVKRLLLEEPKSNYA